MRYPKQYDAIFNINETSNAFLKLNNLVKEKHSPSYKTIQTNEISTINLSRISNLLTNKTNPAYYILAIVVFVLLSIDAILIIRKKRSKHKKDDD